MLTVFKTHQAEEDLYEIWYYIAIEKQNPLNADAFIYQIEASFQTIARTPQIGVSKNEYLGGARQYVFGNYLIFYLIRNQNIDIIRVINGNRNLSPLFT
jgi:toxin ParE1/3/4